MDGTIECASLIIKVNKLEFVKFLLGKFYELINQVYEFFDLIIQKLKYLARSSR